MSEIIERSKLVTVNVVMVDMNIHDLIGLLKEHANLLACAENAQDPSWTIVVKQKHLDD